MSEHRSYLSVDERIVDEHRRYDPDDRISDAVTLRSNGREAGNKVRASGPGLGPGQPSQQGWKSMYR